MSAIRLILVTLLIGLEVCQGAPFSERTHRCRRRCPTCTPDNPEALAAQWNTPEDFEDPLATALSHSGPQGLGPQHGGHHYGLPPPHIHHHLPPPHHYEHGPRHFPHHVPQHYPLGPLGHRALSEDAVSRAERSSDPEEQKFFVVYRGDLDHAPIVQRSVPEPGPRPLSDKELEEVVMRAIIAARRFTESQNALYRQPFFEPQGPNNMRLVSGPAFSRFSDESAEQQMMEPQANIRMQGLRVDPEYYFRPPYQGEMSNQWEGPEPQQQQQSAQIEEQAERTQGAEVEQGSESVMEPEMMEEMVPPPVEEAPEAATTPEP